MSSVAVKCRVWRVKCRVWSVQWVKRGVCVAGGGYLVVLVILLYW